MAGAMNNILSQIGFAVAGAVGGLMLGNAGKLAEMKEELTPMQYAMRNLKGDLKAKLLSLNRVRRRSDRMHYCMEQLTDNLLQLVALHKKVKTPQVPVSMRWGNVAHEYFVQIQKHAQEIDMTLYLERIEGFFKIRNTLMGIVNESHQLMWETTDTAENRYLAALRDPSTGPPPRVNVVASIAHPHQPTAHASIVRSLAAEQPSPPPQSVQARPSAATDRA